MVLVVDQTLVMVSSSHGRACRPRRPCRPRCPPPARRPAARPPRRPTSVPASRLADSVVATPSNLGSQVPWMSAIVPSLPRPVLRTRLFHGAHSGPHRPPDVRTAVGSRRPGCTRPRRIRRPDPSRDRGSRPARRPPGGPCRRSTRRDPLPWYPVSDASDTQLTRDTYERLQAELEDLTTRGRVEIAALIEAARALGDLKENGDYHAAKDSQGKMESRIRQLEQMLKNATVVDGRAPVGRHGGPRLGRDPPLRGRRRGRHRRLLRRLHRGAPGRPDRGLARVARWARPCSATPWATPSSTPPPGVPSGSRS